MADASSVLHPCCLLRVLVLLCLLTGVARAEDARVETGYRNGRPLELRLVTIGWAEVEVTTARAYRAMRDAAEAAGVELGIRSGFRSQERQRWLYQAYRSGWGNPAARPGYSNHQSGRALDLYIDDPRTLAWLGTHAKRFGFRQTVRWLDLGVFAHNTRARAVYRKAGFVELATTRDQFRVGGTSIDDVMMTLAL